MQRTCSVCKKEFTCNYSCEADNVSALLCRCNKCVTKYYMNDQFWIKSELECDVVSKEVKEYMKYCYVLDKLNPHNKWVKGLIVTNYSQLKET